MGSLEEDWSFYDAIREGNLSEVAKIIELKGWQIDKPVIFELNSDKTVAPTCITYLCFRYFFKSLPSDIIVCMYIEKTELTW
jgi:hypothetical protein